MNLAPHLLFVAIISAVIGICGLKSGVMPLRGIRIKRAEYPRLFTFWAVFFGIITIACLSGSIYETLSKA